jgi:hypothetical protein
MNIMQSTVETYIDKYAAYEAAEKAAQDSVNKLSEATGILAPRFGNTEWKQVQFHGMPKLSAARTNPQSAVQLIEWPTPQEITSKLRAYHEALVALDDAYTTVPDKQRSGVKNPPANPASWEVRR